ncbi:MAG: heavy metal-binding domain-containing protein [Deltaproteobacteria bacterium]|nr:heavy metal-binding domain-containing protein [Deltaproteobacteria bacterium]
MRLLLSLAALSLLIACPAEPAPSKPTPVPSFADSHANQSDHHDHGATATTTATATAGYTCPMHPEVRSDVPGKCPKCGMDLVPANPQAAQKTFDVVVGATPPPAAGKPTTLTFEVIDEAKQRVKDFDVVHEMKLHLLVVSNDLSWFAHEHPQLQPDGTMKLEFTFPAAGPHRIYADFKPTGASPQVVQKPIDVAGPARTPTALVKGDLSKAKTIAGHQVRLKASSLNAGDAVRLDFIIVKDGKPVTDIAPYLGAQGHCVIISQDGKQFLHSHPEDGGHDHAAGTGDHAHPKLPGQVTFGTQFPEPGLYKIWGQFLHGTEMVIADFVVDVAPAAKTAKPAAPHSH